MAKHTFSPPVELALATGLPELLDLIHAVLPGALAPALEGEMRDRVAAVSEHWTRKLLAAVLTPPVHVDSSATDGAPLAVVR